MIDVGEHSLSGGERKASYIIVRILGNDLPPRHRSGQTLENLRFTLGHESAFPDCLKLWLVNRIMDPGVEAELVSVLRHHAQRYIVLPFALHGYDVGWTTDRKLCHLMNLNQARNRAITEGGRLATWVLPLDGNTFIPDAAWRGITYYLKHLNNRLFRVWMYRVREHNSEALTLDPGHYRKQEPQVILHHTNPARFDESVPYGNGDKMEFLNRFRFAPNLDYVVRLNDFTRGHDDRVRWRHREQSIPIFIQDAEAKLAAIGTQPRSANESTQSPEIPDTEAACHR